jgi:hypothetical protein
MAAISAMTPSHGGAARRSGFFGLLSGGDIVTARFSSTDRDVSMCRP